MVVHGCYFSSPETGKEIGKFKDCIGYTFLKRMKRIEALMSSREAVYIGTVTSVNKQNPLKLNMSIPCDLAMSFACISLPEIHTFSRQETYIRIAIEKRMFIAESVEMAQ